MARPGKSRDRSSRPATWLFTVGAIYVIVVAAVVFWPTPVTERFEALLRRMHAWLPWSDKALEFGANVLIFVPAGLVAGLLLPQGRRWLAGVGGVLVSVAIEAVQGELLPGRFASVRDVVANSIGVWIGVGAATLFRHFEARRTKEITGGDRDATDRRG